MNALFYAMAWALAAAIPLTDSDIWWHLASAREMVAQGGFLVTDPFTYTAQGLPWHNVHWLYQLVMYGIYKCAGEWGILGGHVLFWGFAGWAWNRSKSSPSMLLVGILCILGIRYLLLARPIALTLLLLGLQIRVWESAWRDRHKLLVLAMLQVLLANIQGLFLLGPFFLLAWMWMGKERGNKLWAWPVFLLGISAIHPHGWHHLMYPWELLLRQLPGNSFAMGIAENVAPLRSLWERGGVLAWGQMIPLAVVSLLWGMRCIHHHTMWILFPIIVLAWLAERNLPLLVLVVLPLVIPRNFANEWASLQKTTAMAILVGFAVAQLQWWRELPGPVAPYRFPEKAVDWLGKSLPEGEISRVFCESRHGGYLTWKLFPRVRTFVDGRFILRDSLFLREYQELQGHPEKIERFDALYGIDWVVLPAEYPPMFQNLARFLGNHPGWRLEYRDENAFVFRNL